MPASSALKPIPRKLVPGRVLWIAAIAAGAWATANAADVCGHNAEITRFLLAFSVILLAARVGGELFDRLN